MNQNDLKLVAKEIRKNILKSSFATKTPHIGPNFSCVEALVALYFSIMEEEDEFILSKGHAGLALYSVLMEKGVISRKTYDDFCKNGSLLCEHPSNNIPGVRVGTGSLGHGLSVAAGIAYSKKIKKEKGSVFCLVGDGECNEGSVWEAAAFAGARNLDNLVCIIDNNNYQALDKCSNVFNSDLIKIFNSFNWNALRTDGHDFKKLVEIKHFSKGWHRPFVISLDTVKGKGVSFMENVLEWHYRVPNSEELQAAIKEISDAK